MLRHLLNFEFFKRRKEYGVIFLRLLIGSFIIWGVQDNILSGARMQEFVGFLAARGVPSPSFAARLSVYTQFVCGVSILIGAFVRLTSIPFIINFVAAIFIAHLGQTFAQMFPALLMIAAGLFFLFHGAGKLSVDEALERRETQQREHEQYELRPFRD
ncbi:MAG: DoxX family protein [Pyrinomonadaceae bacterium]